MHLIPMKFHDFVTMIIKNQPYIPEEDNEFYYESFSLPYNDKRKVQIKLDYNNICNLCNILVTINRTNSDVYNFYFKKYIKMKLVDVNMYSAELVKAYKKLVEYTLYFERIAVSMDIVNVLNEEKNKNSIKMEFKHLFNIDNDLYFKFSVSDKILSFSILDKTIYIEDESFFENCNKLDNVYYKIKCIETLYNEITCISNN